MFFEKLKDKTVADVVDTAKEKVSDTMKSVAEDKGKTILTLLPMAAAAFIIFSRSDGHRDHDIPTKTIVNNYYYYGERQGKHNVPNDH